MYDIDLKKFWENDNEAHKDNCFNPDAKQVALGIRMSEECIYAELGEEGDPWGKNKREKILELNKRYNDKSEKIVGKRLLRETILTKDESYPEIKRIGEIFGGTYKYIPNGGEWLSSDVRTPKELEKLLDRVDKLDLKDFIYPSNWEQEKKRIQDKYTIKPSVLGGVRGPVTLAMSIYGEENLIFLYFDAKELFERFSHTIKNVIIKMKEISHEEAGYTKNNAPHGFGFADDNCSLLNGEMYEIFGYPVLRDVFNKFSPNEGDNRFQHSDSEMEHLLSILSKVNLTGCNFGPTLKVDTIRKHMPNTRIDGQLAPFTFMNNNEEKIIAEIKRDCELIKNTGTRGLNISTAGSINNGSLLTSLRAVMYAIEKYGQY